MAVLGVVPAEERATEGFGLALILEPSGNEGWYFKVLNWASENGLSSDT